MRDVCTGALSNFILQLFAVCQSTHCEKASYLPFSACANEQKCLKLIHVTTIPKKHVISAGTHNCAHPAPQCSSSLQEPTAGTQKPKPH